ncbi:MAG: 50S ribosomal protein L9 [Lachnospiraceae bacterium]|nr:50S ribosomal protein L9 [Lachnospiraceae bacterium]
MKVILLQDVKALGKKGDLVNVNDGYARNYILPKKLGMEANNTNMNNLKLQKQKEDRLAAEELAEAQKLAAELKDITIELQVKTGEGGKVFGSVSAKEIVAAAKAQKNLTIEKKKLLIDEPLKTCGMHIIKVRLHKDVIGEFTVHVSEKQ